MAHIPEAELERLQKEVSVQRLAEAAGVELKGNGGVDLVGRCPFHQDTQLSLIVSSVRNVWQCGPCKKGGGPVAWVMNAQGISFRHAVEVLRSNAPLEKREWAGQVVRLSTVRTLPSPVALESSDAELLRQVVEYYHQTLKQSPEALEYLRKRGLQSPEMVERFRIGFVNRTLGLRLPMKNRDAGAAMRSRLTRLGVLRESGHEHFNGAVVIPISENGVVTGMYGRKITHGLRPGTPLHLYLPGPHQGVWNSEALVVSKTVILCESLIDALTFWCAGFRNVTTSYGAEGFTQVHLSAFKKHQVEKVLISYGAFSEGDAAAQKLSKTLTAEGMDCYRVVLPKAMDVNEYALKVQPAEKALGLALRQATWMGKGTKPAPVEIPQRLSKEVLASSPKKSEPLPTEAKPTALPAEAIAVLKRLGPEAIAAAAVGVAVADAEIRKPVCALPAPSKTTTPAATPPAPTPTLPVAPQSSGQQHLTAPRGALPVAPPVVSEASTAVACEPAVPKAPEVPTKVKEEEVLVTLGERRYRVRGLGKNLSYDSLKVNVLVSKGEGFHVDALDLYSARQRAAYVKQAAAELGVSEEVTKADLGRLLLKLEELQEANIAATLAPKQNAVALTEGEREAALALLKSPELLKRILLDFQKCGVVGEENNKLLGYLAAVSRKLESPLAVLIQSSSAAGKTSLMDAVLSFLPEEEVVKYSAMTGQSLFYMGEADLKHKVLAVVEEEGASRAAYALKLLQSEGELTIASTGKDASTGRLVTHEYKVEGPVQLFLTTTAIELDEELLNRCVVLSVDEDREQTKAIHKLQRESQTLEGLLLRREREKIVKLHRDAQRLLRPLLVANPYATELTFLDDKTRTRRDHLKYLTLIRTIALLHQYQRPVKTVVHEGQTVEYVEVTKEDIALANQLAHQALGHSLDELPPQTRRLLGMLDKMASETCQQKSLLRKDFRFSRRELRQRTGFGDTQLKVHLARLVELEYLAVHHEGNRFAYELLYDGQGEDGTPFLRGLLEVKHLYDVSRSAPEADANELRSGSGRPLVGPRSGDGRGGKNDEKVSELNGLHGNSEFSLENALLGTEKENLSSYLHPLRSDTTLAAEG